MRVSGTCRAAAPRGVCRVGRRGLLAGLVVGVVSVAVVPAFPAALQTWAGAETRPAHTGGAQQNDAAPGAAPDLASAVAYLTRTTNLVDGDHYEPSGPGTPDVGLTIDGALALAATGAAAGTLAAMVRYVAANGAGWTGYGTPDASGGSLAKEALLAEVVGDDPHDFGGENLIGAVDATVCRTASTGTDAACAAAGNYAYASSTFDQALGIVAQLRAGDAANAAAPVRYLESLQNGNGGWPSSIPPGSSPPSDVDSTAMAVMALDLVPGHRAAVAVAAATRWIAGRQESNGGYPGASGDNTNSAALALMAMDLDRHAYVSRIRAALRFLADEQDPDGGFTISSDPGSPRGSDLRASTQAVSGAVGTSFGTLHTGAASVAGTGPIGACTATTGVIVVVDFSHWGGDVERGCDADPTTGFAALHAAGFTTAGDAHDGSAFVCRIDDEPPPSEDPCITTPPATAYWSYWHADAAQNTWSYSEEGAMSDHPPPGSVDAWTFGSTALGGTDGEPPFPPSAVRATTGSVGGVQPVAGVHPTVPRIVDAEPAAADHQSAGSPVPLLVGGVVIMLLVGTAALVARRRRGAG